MPKPTKATIISICATLSSTQNTSVTTNDELETKTNLKELDPPSVMDNASGMSGMSDDIETSIEIHEISTRL